MSLIPVPIIGDLVLLDAGTYVWTCDGFDLVERLNVDMRVLVLSLDVPPMDNGSDYAKVLVDDGSVGIVDYDSLTRHLA